MTSYFRQVATLDTSVASGIQQWLPYIFMERNGIHIIDLNKTVAKVDEAAEVLKGIAKSGKKILFVATKKQAKDIVAEKAASVNMPYVIERWPVVCSLTSLQSVRLSRKWQTSIS